MSASEKRAAEHARQAAWIKHWTSQHVWSADGKTATPKPGWCWKTAMDAHGVWTG